jgi:Arc/MetJ-type ribon-helix-helix transcriptional regulator
MYIILTDENMTKQKTKVIATRIPEQFAEILQTYCKKEAYINLADLLRDALRNKIQHEAPQLYNQLFQELTI